MKIISTFLVVLSLFVFFNLACKKPNKEPGKLELVSCFAGDKDLNSLSAIEDVPYNMDFIIKFSAAIDTNSVKTNILLKDNANATVSGIYFAFADGYKTVIVKHYWDLDVRQNYTLLITKFLTGSQGETYIGSQFHFTTHSSEFILSSVTLNNQNFMPPVHLYNVPYQGLAFTLEFSDAVDTNLIKSKFTLSGKQVFNLSLSNSNKTIQLQCTSILKSYTQYSLEISSTLNSKTGYKFNGFTNWFVSGIDSSLKFPLITDDELLTLIQKQTFTYFYDYAHPASGMARDRYGSGDVVTIGGTGFGVMATIVAMERGFISREQGIAHVTKIIRFLETCDRFHGAWPHFINGSTGKVIPFSTKDDGGDLVETAFMIQGLITLRQYLNTSIPAESDLITRITNLYNMVEWDWYTRGGLNALWWHWSPNYGWDMNFKLQGYNETLITYIVAASSTTHTIPAAAYSLGFARNGAIKNGKSFYDYVLPLGYDYGGPLFFAHYSFLGLDPRKLSDTYANYWTQNVHHSLINWAYCTANPKHYPNYNAYCWGLTASDIPNGYSANEPTNDIGVISPTAAVSSLPYTPEQSMNAIRYFYYIVGDRLWGTYGFHDAFSVTQSWWADSYLAIDQGPEIVMIENYRTGLLWNLFMSAPEVQSGLTKLGFSYK